MQNLALLVGALMAVSNLNSTIPTADKYEWQNFKELHGKSYPDADIDHMKRLIYSYNKQQVTSFVEHLSI